jgi:hypothetical protein
MGTNKTYPFQQVEQKCPPSFVRPKLVVDAALSEIQEDGKVIDTDSEIGKAFYLEPNELRDLDDVPPDVFEREVRKVARIISGAVGTVSLELDRPERVAARIKTLAHYLTGYRHNRAFIDFAASLVRIEDEQGLACLSVHLPEGDPWDWVSRVQERLVVENKIHEAQHSTRANKQISCTDK